MTIKPKILQLRHEAYCLAAEQETILRKLRADCEWFDEQIVFDKDLNSTLARAVSAASETLKYLDAYACVLEKLEPLMMPPDV